jgi:hypothetical protein
MSQPAPATHPSVVLRSHYTHLRAMLVAAMIAVVGLSAAVVILATDDQRSTVVSAAAPITAPDPSSARYDGGPEEGSAAPIQRSRTATAAATSIASPFGARYDGGPEEGTGAALSSDAPSHAVPGTRYDGGPEEGSAATAR